MVDTPETGDPGTPETAPPKARRGTKAKPAARKQPAAPKQDTSGAAAVAAPDTPVDVDTKAKAEVRQFVIFSIEGEDFAVALSEVKEIIRIPDIVHLPLAPPSLEGLANLRGSVLPVVNTRRLFGLPEREHDDTTRVVILDGARPVGIVVDDVANVVSVEADRIEAAGGVTTTVQSDLLEGVIKPSDGRGMVMVLDAKGMIAREFDALDHRSPERAGLAMAMAQAEAADALSDDQMQLVSFEVAGQEYGLEICNVQEIVQIPERITQVPKAAPAVIGMMNLRDRLLPVLSMRALFGMMPEPLAEHNRIVVITLDDGESAVGLAMDRVKEVLRVPRGLVEPMPPLLAADANLRDISAVCRLDGGNRIVSVLAAERLFDEGEVRDSLAAIVAEEGPSMTERSDTGTATEEEQFIVFRLMNEEYGVAIAEVQEIVRLPETIARVPKAPDFIEGVINLRGSVIPLVDQRRRFGLPAQDRSDRQRVMVFAINGVQTGFIVDSVSEVMRIGRSHIEEAPELSREQAQMIRRVANLVERKRMILLLESDRLLDGAELAALDAAA